MLVLSRKTGERILIGPNIEIIVTEVRGDRVRLGFTCPPNVRVIREELQ
jgi:carbon storage regulator